MRIVLPIIERDPDSTICRMDERECFAFMDLDAESRIKTIDFFDDKDEIFSHADILVIQDAEEDVAEFLEMGVTVLQAEFGSTVEDVHEAFMFTQLREIG